MTILNEALLRLLSWQGLQVQSTDEKGQTAERGVANMLAVGCSGRVVEYSDRFDVVTD